MTAARHASPRLHTVADAATVTAQAVIGMVAVLGLIALQGLPANVAPARPWHYPCVVHVSDRGRIETFSPFRLLMKGDCLQ